ncbi:TPR-like protein [Aaosphaeria arxii CBS 175.79]|uniref:TPR-like protein n=1 Tax=Aaosphaeria arxii CBS 175.79 TaxID=1450172 RepID=A0A6A5YAC7_9PLEO|nr:TPR-like protein [Aaosphaeria arxii CBS 175.79]KAF2022398.1 TPR-like protein [Aaosphaeria arxii CBS 175.79]
MYQDILTDAGKDKSGFEKLRFCSQQTAKDGLQFLWVDTCCIDKSNVRELDTAINSMFKWYKGASKCYVYLSDVSVPTDFTDAVSCQAVWADAFRNCRWFTRGFTLQELVAPAVVEFFSKEGKILGTKSSLEGEIHEITKIPVSALRGQVLDDFSIEDRMSWGASRATTLKEDKVYCLLGICGVFLPLIYGEGEEYATKRLIDEVERRRGRHTKQVNSTDPNAVRPGVIRPSCVIPFRRDPEFVDRGTLLDDIQEKCSTPASRVALVGLGGVGKSQLAIEFCYRTVDRSPGTWIFWVHAGNASRLEQGYRDIANQVQLAGRTDPQANVFELVRDWLLDESHGKWLLVLDNADDSDVIASVSGSHGQQHLSRYLPPSKYGTVIVTSRSSHAASRLVEDRDTLHIKPMRDTDAQVLLRRKLGDAVELEDVVELAAALELMPLALVQAAAYIQKQGPHYSIRKYLAAFHKSDRRKTSLLNREAGHLRRDNEAKNSIITTWQISFETIRSTRRSAADLLSLMSFFDRQGIPKALLSYRSITPTICGSVDGNVITQAHDKQDTFSRHCASEDSGSENSDDDAFTDDVQTLRDYSFVSETNDPGSLEMHRLVQLATQEWLEGRNEAESWKDRFISNLFDAFPPGEYENWEKCQRLYPHAVAASHKKPQSLESCKKWARLLYHAAWYASSKGNFVEVEPLITKSMGVTSKFRSPDSFETLQSMALLGGTKHAMGQWDAAERLKLLVVNTCKKRLGEDDSFTQMAMNGLSLTYRMQGRLKAAEELLEQVVEISKRKVGEDHRDTLTFMGNLAGTYMDQGRWDVAEKLLVRVVDVQKRMLGEDHPDTLSSIHGLASTNMVRGRCDVAEKLLVRVVDIQKRKLGEDHPDTLNSINTLAYAWKDQGRITEAIALMRKCVQLTTRRLGHTHCDTLTSTEALSSWEETLNDPDGT